MIDPQTKLFFNYFFGFSGNLNKIFKNREKKTKPFPLGVSERRCHLRNRGIIIKDEVSMFRVKRNIGVYKAA